MAIDRPGAIEPHPRLKPKGRSAAEDGRPNTFLARARNAVGRGPALLRGVARQGKKVDRPPLRSDDRGAAGPRPDSPIRGPRGAPRTSARRRDGNRLRDARGRTDPRAERLALAHQRRRVDFTETPQAPRRIRGDRRWRARLRNERASMAALAVGTTLFELTADQHRLCVRRVVRRPVDLAYRRYRDEERAGHCRSAMRRRGCSRAVG